MSVATALGTMAATLTATTGLTRATATDAVRDCRNAFVSVDEARVRSGDAEIAYSLFLPHEGTGRPVPAVISTHGYGEGRRTEQFSPAHRPFGPRRVCTLLSWGYAVLTFDQRGFNDSSGTSQWTHPAFEGRDFVTLVDLLASDTPVRSDKAGTTAPLNQLVRQDRRGDPRVGAYGGSVGGAAVAIGASVDPRVDALVLFNTWGDARQSFAPQNVPKRSWLTAAGYTSPNNPNIPGVDAATELPRQDTVGGEPELLSRMVREALIDGKFAERTREDLWRRSPLRYTLRPERLTPMAGEPEFEPVKVRGIEAPTLLVQSPNDVVFPTNELLALHRALRGRGVPARELWYCSAGEHAGAHNSATFGIAPPCRSATAAEHDAEKDAAHPRGDTQLARIDEASRRWLDRYLSGDRDVETGARFDLQLQDGTWQTLDELPAAGPTARWKGSLDHRVVPTSGYLVGPAPAGCTPPPHTDASAAGVTTLWCPDLPAGAQRVDDLAPGDVLLGVPRLRVTMPAPAEDAIVFVRLLEVAESDGPGYRVRVLGEQDKPIRLSSPVEGRAVDPKGKAKTVPDQQQVTLELPGVAWRVAPGTEIHVEVATSSNAFVESRSVWSVSGEIEIDLPLLPTS